MRIRDGIEVNNYQKFRDLMNFSDPDKVWYAVALQRFKDGNPVKNRFFEYKGYWFIKSDSDFEKFERESKAVSLKENARIYGFPNARSLTAIGYWGNIYKKRRIKHPFLEAASRSLDLPDRPITHIDIDTTNTSIHSKVRDILSREGITPLFEYNSPSGGIHFVLPDKRAFDIQWENEGVGTKIVNGEIDPYSVVGVELDKPILVYYDGSMSSADYSQYDLKRQKRGIDLI